MTMNFSLVLLMRAGLQLFSLPLNVALVDHLAYAYARLARRTHSNLLPRHIRDFPRRFLALVGDELAGAVDTQSLMTERLVYHVRKLLITEALTPSSESAARFRALIEVSGLEHLDAALARGRGAFVVTAHFGFPYLIRAVLEGYASEVVTAQWEPRRVGDITLQGDVWARTTALHRIRQTLERNHICLILPDGDNGVTRTLPFFGHQLRVALGPFYLGSRVPSPILPCYAVIAQRLRAFRVEFLPPLTCDPSSTKDPPAVAISEFVEHYCAWITRYPSHLGI